ncbi:hypothetical protein LWI29_003380 [Acer saccharum]|uniref:YqgF/RNase H-like domain-containing protein n=1 Tax=Acer saccharum TaxID=4024 RepID=A0AA39UPI8_ACESA|nr:hypothetical protein LWI29_003380 [Acer saccharum]
MYMIYEKIYIQQYRIGRKYLWEILNFSQMEYLKPVNFYEEIFKDILKKEDYLKPGRLMGLDVSDKYVSLAVSDWKNKTAVPLRALDRQEINMSSMADLILSLISEHNLVGFVIGTKYGRPMDAQTQNFIDDLCKTRKVKGLKYTVWVFWHYIEECRICIQAASEIYFREFESASGHVKNSYGEVLCCLCTTEVPGLYKQDGVRGWGLNIDGYRTNPSS